MQFIRFSTGLLFFLVAALAGCGGGTGGAGTGSTGGSGGSGDSGGSGGSPSFQPRPFPGDFFVTPPAPEFRGESDTGFPGNVVYDSKLKEFFFSNPAMNEVEAYSTVDGHRVGAVTVPGAIGLSLAPDGSELAVGTSTPHVYFVDPAALHVTGQIEIPASVIDPSSTLEPVLPFLMAAGPMLIEAGNSKSVAPGMGNLISYDRASGAFANANPGGPDVGLYGVTPARSLDGKYLVVPTLGQTGPQMAVYSAEAQAFIGATPAQFSIAGVAANPDGSQFAMVGTLSYASSSEQYITFWDRGLQQQAQYTSQDSNIVFSHDGKYLYAFEPFDVLALDAKTALPAGYQGLTLAARRANLWDTDESNRVYGIADLGAFVASVAQLQPTVPAMPWFSEQLIGNSIGNPNEGPLSGGTQVQFTPGPPASGNSDGLGSTMEAYFGTTPATKDVVTTYPSSSNGLNFFTATSPAATASGPVTVLLTDANNNAVLLPGGYSYGPHAHWIDPSAVSSKGEVPAIVWADGLVPFQSPSVTVGGLLAGTSPLSIVGPDTWRELQVDVPYGLPGWADLKLSLMDGTSETTRNMVQHLTQDVTLTTAAYTSAIYDPSRDRFYLAGPDNTIGVFDPETQSLLQPMQSSTISSGAVLGSVALTPDNAKLVVSDPTDHSVVVFDLTSGTSTAVNVLVPSDGAATVTSPMPVITVAGDRAFVLLTGWTQDDLREIDLARMTVRVRTDVQSGNPFAVVPSTMASSTDGSVAVLAGAFYAWKYDPASDAFSAPTEITYTGGDTVAVNADGTVLAAAGFALDQNLRPRVPFQFVGIRNLLTGSGGLRYTYGWPGEINISDTRNGRSLLTMPPLPPSSTTPDWAKAFAIDPSGRKILAAAGTSLNYYELAVVPLAAGTVSPAEATPGATLKIRGNGFVAGTTATIAGKSASCTPIDDQTLQCVLPSVKAGLAPMTLSNPDGQTYLLEAAVSVD